MPVVIWVGIRNLTQMLEFAFLTVKRAQRESESHFETHKSYLSRVYWECLKGDGGRFTKI